MRLPAIILVAAAGASCGGAIIGGVGGGTGGAGGGGGASTELGQELPCDVAAVLSSACVGCHGASPVSGAARLVSRADFSAAVPGDPTRTYGELAVLRMRAASNGMPPSGPLPVASIAAVEGWVAAGMPAGACGAIDAGVFVETCASGSTWTGGNRESRDMNPGLPCLACHVSRQEEDKQYPFSGTIYPALHERDLCNAKPPSDARIEIYDKNGALALTMTPEPQSGNFHSPLVVSVALPYTAQVVTSRGVRKMNEPQTSGDCNGCHTVKGAFGAYGRIAWPE